MLKFMAGVREESPKKNGKRRGFRKHKFYILFTLLGKMGHETTLKWCSRGSELKAPTTKLHLKFLQKNRLIRAATSTYTGHFKSGNLMSPTEWRMQPTIHFKS
jgi:hypothetical protein